MLFDAVFLAMPCIDQIRGKSKSSRKRLKGALDFGLEEIVIAIVVIVGFLMAMTFLSTSKTGLEGSINSFCEKNPNSYLCGGESETINFEDRVAEASTEALTCAVNSVAAGKEQTCITQKFSDSGKDAKLKAPTVECKKEGAEEAQKVKQTPEPSIDREYKLATISISYRMNIVNKIEFKINSPGSLSKWQEIEAYQTQKGEEEIFSDLIKPLSGKTLEQSLEILEKKTRDRGKKDVLTTRANGETELVRGILSVGIGSPLSVPNIGVFIPQLLPESRKTISEVTYIFSDSGSSYRFNSNKWEVNVQPPPLIRWVPAQELKGPLYLHNQINLPQKGEQEGLKSLLEIAQAPPDSFLIIYHQDGRIELPKENAKPDEFVSAFFKQEDTEDLSTPVSKINCNVKNFNLPQAFGTLTVPKVGTELKPSQWIAGLGDPQYLVYWQDFPTNEDASWNSQEAWMSNAIFLAISALPVGGIVTKTVGKAYSVGRGIVAIPAKATATALKSGAEAGKKAFSRLVAKAEAGAAEKAAELTAEDAYRILSRVKKEVEVGKQLAEKATEKTAIITIEKGASKEAARKALEEASVNNPVIKQALDSMIEEASNSIGKEQFKLVIKTLGVSTPLAWGAAKLDSKLDKYTSIPNNIVLKQPKFFNDFLNTYNLDNKLADTGNPIILKKTSKPSSFYLASPCYGNITVSTSMAKCELYSYNKGTKLTKCINPEIVSDADKSSICPLPNTLDGNFPKEVKDLAAKELFDRKTDERKLFEYSGTDLKKIYLPYAPYPGWKNAYLENFKKTESLNPNIYSANLVADGVSNTEITLFCGQVQAMPELYDTGTTFQDDSPFTCRVPISYLQKYSQIWYDQLTSDTNLLGLTAIRLVSDAPKAQFTKFNGIEFNLNPQNSVSGPYFDKTVSFKDNNLDGLWDQVVFTLNNNGDEKSYGFADPNHDNKIDETYATKCKTPAIIVEPTDPKSTKLKGDNGETLSNFCYTKPNWKASAVEYGALAAQIGITFAGRGTTWQVGVAVAAGILLYGPTYINVNDYWPN